MDRLQAAIEDLIARSGPIGFDEYMAQALYAPGLGFYASGAGAGRRRDFLTSPEVGPLFGAVVARALDAWWDDAGRPASSHQVSRARANTAPNNGPTSGLVRKSRRRPAPAPEA